MKDTELVSVHFARSAESLFFKQTGRKRALTAYLNLRRSVMKEKKPPFTFAVKFVYMIWGLAMRVIYPPKIEYRDESTKRLLKEEKCIIIANHTEHTDGYYIPQVLPSKKMYTYVTRKWYDKKKLNWLFRRLRYIPINLAEMDTEWLDKGKRVLDGGNSVMIFPEGKLSKNGRLDAFHPGFLMLARQTDVPIVPIVLLGKYKKFRRKRIIVGSPIETDLHEKGRPSVILRRQADLCHGIMAEMLGMPEVEMNTAEDMSAVH